MFSLPRGAKYLNSPLCQSCILLVYYILQVSQVGENISEMWFAYTYQLWGEGRPARPRQEDMAVGRHRPLVRGVAARRSVSQHFSMSVPMCTCENGRRSLWDVSCSWRSIQTTVFWYLPPCRFVGMDQNLRKACCFHLTRRETKTNEIKHERTRMKKRTKKSPLLRKRNMEKKDLFYFFIFSFFAISAMMNQRFPFKSDYQNFCSRRSISKFLGLSKWSLSIRRQLETHSFSKHTDITFH